jgi:DNA-directed RNA polymerase specialized sigma subunit
MKVLNASYRAASTFKPKETTIVTYAAFDALDCASQLEILKTLINDLRVIYSDKLKEQRVVKPIKTLNIGVRQRENAAAYLRMEGRTYKEVGEIMGISQERVRQILRNHEQHCMKEATWKIPTTHEVTTLLPHIDSIKAIYEQ